MAQGLLQVTCLSLEFRGFVYWCTQFEGLHLPNHSVYLCASTATAFSSADDINSTVRGTTIHMSVHVLSPIPEVCSRPSGQQLQTFRLHAQNRTNRQFLRLCVTFCMQIARKREGGISPPLLLFVCLFHQLDHLKFLN